MERLIRVIRIHRRSIFISIILITLVVMGINGLFIKSTIKPGEMKTITFARKNYKSTLTVKDKSGFFALSMLHKVSGELIALTYDQDKRWVGKPVTIEVRFHESPTKWTTYYWRRMSGKELVAGKVTPEGEKQVSSNSFELFDEAVQLYKEIGTDGIPTERLKEFIKTLEKKGKATKWQ